MARAACRLTSATQTRRKSDTCSKICECIIVPALLILHSGKLYWLTAVQRGITQPSTGFFEGMNRLTQFIMLTALLAALSLVQAAEDSPCFIVPDSATKIGRASGRDREQNSEAA